MYSTTRMFITSLITGILFFGCTMLLSAFGHQMPAAVAANAPVWQPAAPPASATNAIVTTPVELDIAIIGSNPSLQVGGVASYTVYITNTTSANAVGATMSVTPFHGIVLEPTSIPLALPTITASKSISQSLRVRADIASTLTVTVTVQSGGSSVVADNRSESVAPSKRYIPLVFSDLYQAGVSLGQPAGATPINFLYMSQECTAPNGRPKTILAGTDKGLYSLTVNNSWSRNPTLASTIQASHILSTTQAGMFIASFNMGIWRSTDGGKLWSGESLPNDEKQIYWLAAGDSSLYAAGSKGLYKRSNTQTTQPWILLPGRNGKYFSVAALGSTIYAIQVGGNKDTLVISADQGNTWIAKQIPRTFNFMQTLDAFQGKSASTLLIGTVKGGLYTLNASNDIIPFSQGLSLTVYGIWHDSQKRVYAALDMPGGLKRFPATGGVSDRDLSAVPGGSLTNELLYTVNGNLQCNMIAVGSQSGGVWLKRIP